MNPAINGAVKSRAGHHTVVAIVEDKPGVLMRVSSLFPARLQHRIPHRRP
jgi:hypothetical protein